MQAKIYIVIFVVVIALGGLIFASTANNSRAVVTVSQLVSENLTQQKVQIGAQVAKDSEIEVVTEPSRQVVFWVRDRESEQPRLQVVYQGVMPDTLRPGRDVIIQGQYDGQKFKAHQLLTQCPSKYEPPKPGENYNGEKYSEQRTLGEKSS